MYLGNRCFSGCNWHHYLHNQGGLLIWGVQWWTCRHVKHINCLWKLIFADIEKTCWIWEELLPTLPLFQYTCGAPQKGPSRMLVATESILIYTFLHSNLLVCVPSPKPGGLGTNNCWPSLQAVAAWYVFEALVFAKKHAPPWFALPCSRAMKPPHRIVRLCLLGPSTCTVYYIFIYI